MDEANGALTLCLTLIRLQRAQDREFYPPGTSGPWPGTFSTDSGVAPVHPSSLVHAVVTLAASHLLIGHC